MSCTFRHCEQKAAYITMGYSLCVKHYKECADNPAHYDFRIDVTKCSAFDNESPL